MTTPQNSEQFLALVRASGLVDEVRLRGSLQRLSQNSELSGDVGKLSGQLVRDGLLTVFQAEQFLLGKWRGFSIGKYLVLERLGAGNQCSVYLCEDKTEQRLVAVKVLPASSAQDPDVVARFSQEGHILASLDHPHVIKGLSVVHEGPLHFIAMDLVDGSTLQDIVADHGPMAQSFATKRSAKGPMEIRRAACYVQQAAEGLRYLHEVAGIVHGDIEPGNLMLDRQGTIKIIDLGLGRFAREAPIERPDGAGSGARADQYSLGAVLHFLLTGRSSARETPKNSLGQDTRQSRPVQEVPPEVPKGLALIVDRLMAKNRENCYQDFIEVIDALAPWAETSDRAPPIDEMPRYCPLVMRLLSS